MIYTASKTKHADKWRQLRAEGWPIISTWIDEAGVGQSASLSDLWHRCIQEATIAECVLLYREPGEVLKGAFIEVGAALAHGNVVYAVGCEEFSFINHVGVKQCPTIAAALIAIHSHQGIRPKRVAV